MGTAEFGEAIRNIGPIGALLATLATLLASVVRALINGAIIPRKSHEEIVNGYKERAAAAEHREQWWRDQAFSGTTMAGRALDITADLATRRALSTPTRDEGGGTGHE